MNPHVYEKLQTARDYLLSRLRTVPSYVLTLGSGLSGLVDQMETESELELGDIPFFRSPSVEGHRGKLIIGKLNGVRIMGVQGRLHYYEGLPLEEVVFPMRALAFAGADTFLLTNAAGAVDPKLRPADLVLITDHINYLGNNPLIGPNDSRLGPRFPDLTEAYDKKLRDVFHAEAKANNIGLQEGVYLVNSGPSYETPSEVRLYRMFGASVVGMSTVPEVIALRHMNKRVAAISCVTNLAAGINPDPLQHADVMKVAELAYPKLSKLLQATLKRLEEERA